MTDEMGFVKKVIQEGKETYLPVTDKKVVDNLLGIYANIFLDMIKESLPKEGSFLKVNGREFLILQYISYEDDAYMVMISSDKPTTFKVGKIVIKDSIENYQLVDVTSDNDGVAVLKMFVDTNNKK